MSILEEDIPIRTPADLVGVLREVRARIADGRLREIEGTNPLISVSSLREISDEGPWPDYFEVVVEDYQGRRYRLTAETYHGTGGSWSRI